MFSVSLRWLCVRRCQWSTHADGRWLYKTFLTRKIRGFCRYHGNVWACWHIRAHFRTRWHVWACASVCPTCGHVYESTYRHVHSYAGITMGESQKLKRIFSYCQSPFLHKIWSSRLILQLKSWWTGWLVMSWYMIFRWHQYTDISWSQPTIPYISIPHKYLLYMHVQISSK